MTSAIAIATAASSIAFTTAGAAETTAMGEQKLRWETGSVTVQAKGVTAVGTASIRAGWDEIDTLEVDVWTEPQGKASRVREEGRTIISRDQFVHGTIGGYPVTGIDTTHIHTINKS
ncbi:hypothetical protein [Ornithinimicrobium panacihumi]|uniref:hypothetical protein n=1 Tax=Ornithinimicrobium panacihumi TaxID=2008449 RepID=UPI003F8C6DF3